MNKADTLTTTEPRIPNATLPEFDFADLNTSAEFAVYQAVIAAAQKSPGPDAVIVENVAAQVRQMAKDDADDASRPGGWAVFNQKRFERFHEMQRILSATPAHSLAGLQAKAIIVRRYHGPGCIQPSGDEDSAVAWSLAGDLLGLPSAIYGKGEP